MEAVADFSASKSFKKQTKTSQALNKGRKKCADAAHNYLIEKGIGTETGGSKEEHGVHLSANVGEILNCKTLSADVGASVGCTSAGASASPVGAYAGAGATGAEAKAGAALVEGLLEAEARAVCAEASADAGVGLEHLGAYAGARATTAKVEAGIKHTPLQAHAVGPSADAEAGVSWDYTGANVGAYAGEARAGPFAARAGVKFGVGLRNGVPELDLGPITTPCSIM